ncbi:sulfite exporter TauE/SafE family protein [Kribbella turkmenica]|uniref:Probable membrane transporter protein n=1 Tax=Kribbella turkmenica TaxID=2530375 RepID=A0A4R4XES8_9ACTN|nr:sulfite exporter TauE/SafE family protein [Kribbella turkmenica]TDD29205.1 sulfite exporter TauE/SafE family protein [Kribbella turkmenica]
MLENLVVVTVVALAGALVGISGFGFNIAATPALALVMPSKVAVVIALANGVSTNGILSFTMRWPRAKLVELLIGSALGIALAAGFVAKLDETTVRMAVAVVALTSIAMMVRGQRATSRTSQEPAKVRRQPKGRTAAVLVGGVSGVLASATGMGAPVVAAYLSRCGVESDEIRSIVTIHTCAVNLVVIGAAMTVGSVDLSALWLACSLLPVSAVGLLAGALVYRKFNRVFRPTVFAMMFTAAAVSVVLLISR